MSGAECEYCGQPVSPTRAGTFVWTSGWVEQRRDGGAHAITLPVRADRYACGSCIDMLRAGVSPGQGTLL